MTPEQRAALIAAQKNAMRYHSLFVPLTPNAQRQAPPPPP